MKTVFLLFTLLVCFTIFPLRGQQNLSLYKSDTLSINGLTLIQVSQDGKFISLRTISSDTIVNAQTFYSRMEYLDINEDGEQDIRVYVISNTPNQCENYFFDKRSKSFKQILNCDLDIKLIEGSNLFYSYNRAGCADLDWESHLIKIENWSAENFGFMNAKGCGDNDDGIYIYKVSGDTHEILEKYPMEQFDNNGSNNKWSFIENYWSKNYKKFLPR